MALVVKDRVKETTTTTGTGTITLAGASQGFQSFSVIGNGNTTYYTIVDPATGDWEVGVGTYTSSGTTLSRTTVLESSNAGSLVPFGAGTKDVFVTYPAERAVYLDTAGSAVTVLDVGTLGTSTANITTANITSGTVSTTPTSSTDIANKTYVDNLVASGTSYHTPVKYEVPNTTGNLNALYNNGTGGVGATLTNNGTLAAFAPDGPTASVNDRILVYNQTNAYENGVYEVTTVGSGSVAWVLTRTADADSYGLKDPNALGNGDAFFVTSGDTGAGETYICNTVGTITFGTTAITFAQISAAQVYSAGTGISLSPATTINIANTGVSANTYGSASAVPVFAVNAQGQITSVTDTNIAISGSAVSGNISGSAGSVANALTAGTYLTSGGTFDGSAARTFAVDATDANTASKVVARDASGNFSAGTITASLSGAATSATTATNLAGGTLGDIPYQSAAGTTVFLTGGTNGYVLKSNGAAAPTWAAATISGVQLGNNLNTLTLGSYLTGTSYNGSAAVTAAVDATSANTASKVVARDASGNFSAGTITATLSGNASTATSATSATTASQIDGIEFRNGNSSNGVNPDTINDNGTGYVNSVSLFGQIDGALYSQAYSTSWVHQIFGDYRTGQLAVRGRNSGTLTPWRVILDSTNYNSYAPTLTGTGASGTWGINISGNAVNLSTTRTNWSTNGTITAVVGQLAWKNYGNNHTIFDASAGTSPDGTAVNNTDSQVAWTGTFPTLMGWNGINTYGVRVDSARVADTAGNANLLNNLSSTQLFNNMGQNHNTYTNADSFTNFGTQYLQGPTNGPGAGGSQWYMLGMGLGNEYSYSQYAMQFAIPRTPTGGNPYISVRFREGGSWNSWAKIWAGYADTAGSATTATNLAGGSAGTIPYQSAAGTTVQLAAGSSGQVLTSNGAAAPSWATPTSPPTIRAPLGAVTGAISTWEITNYNSATSYTVSTTNGTVAEGGGSVYYTPTSSGAGGFTINGVTTSITVDGAYFLAVLSSSSESAISRGVGYDADGNVYAVAALNSTFMVYKYNINGVLQWQRYLVPTNYTTAWASRTDSLGNTYVVGTSTAAEASGNTFVAAYNKDGVLLFQTVTQVTLFTNEVAYNLVVKGSNLYYVGKMIASPSQAYQVLGRLYTNGNVLPHPFINVAYMQSDTTSAMEGYDIAVDDSGNVYTASYYDDFISIYNYTTCLWKTDSTGTNVWQLRLDTSTGVLAPQGLATDSQGNVYLAATDNTSGSMVIKFTSAGVVSWARRIASVSYESIAIDPSTDNIYVCGYRVSGVIYQGFVASYDALGSLKFRNTLAVSSPTSAGTGIIARAIAVSQLNKKMYLTLEWYANTTYAYKTPVVACLPTDGSKTGTYTLAGINFTYASNTNTASTPTITAISGSFYNGKAPTTVTPTSLTSSASSLTAARVTIP